MRFLATPCLVAALFTPVSLNAQAPTTAQSSRRPNVIIILADDMGFSDIGCYGGEIHTPALDQLAREGVRFTQFYNMARCCPTRASILTGLYPHQTGLGHMNQNHGRPGYEGELNDHCVTIAEALRQSGYRTGMVGKWHLCRLNIARAPGEQQKAMLAFENDTPISPSTDNWPTHRGFEEFWGTIPGVDSFYDPYGLVHNDEPIRPDRADFYYTDFITDHTIEMIDRYARDENPFFLYVAYTAPHWPMQARDEDIKRYSDTYKVGWDAIREERFSRLIELGMVKKEWGLSPRASAKSLNDGASAVGPWEDAKAKDWQAQRMAVYAGMIECMDRGVGRIAATLRKAGIDDNTLIVFLSDNGACQENVRPEWYDIPDRTRDGRKIHVGNRPEHAPGPETVYQSYGPAWANASNTPFRRFKHFTEEGGISAPCIVRWPAGRLEPGRIEKKHVGNVLDLMPTILAAAGAIYPKDYQGRPIPPAEGRNLLPVLRGTPSFDRGALCWEHEGNRAVRIGDWKLVAPHREPWRLYHMTEDRTELHDVAKDHLEKVAELKAAYEAWANRCGVQPWPIRQ